MPPVKAIRPAPTKAARNKPVAAKKAPAAGKPAAVRPPVKAARGARRTDEILRVGSDLFLQHGYEQTSIDEIIQRTGGSKSHVYRKFRHKEGLFLACIDYLLAEIHLAVEIPGVASRPVAEGMRLMARALVDVLLGPRHLAFQRLVFAEAARFPRAGALWFEQGPQTTARTFRAAIQQWMRRGELRSGDALLLANLFGDMLSGHLLDRAWLGVGKRPSPAEITRLIDTAVELFLKGFAA